MQHLTLDQILEKKHLTVDQWKLYFRSFKKKKKHFSYSMQSYWLI